MLSGQAKFRCVDCTLMYEVGTQAEWVNKEEQLRDVSG